MEDNDIGERLIKLEERFKSNTHRIDNLEKLSESINAQNQNIAELVIELKHTNEHLRTQDERLDVIEGTPRLRQNQFVGAIISSFVSAIFGFFAARFML